LISNVLVGVNPLLLLLAALFAVAVTDAALSMVA
jgi:hypothetical protein